MLINKPDKKIYDVSDIKGINEIAYILDARVSIWNSSMKKSFNAIHEHWSGFLEMVCVVKWTK